MATSIQVQDTPSALLVDPVDPDVSDEEQAAAAASAAGGEEGVAANVDDQSDTSVREIYKNSWLKQIPPTDKWSGRLYKAQKPEKFWVVFCVHDEKDPFLEFYENRRSAYSHNPLSSVDLNQCLHISPTIVVQENDYEFAITLQMQVIRLAASTREQMVEWMDTMRNKLRELKVLEPKDNLYSREPIASPKSTECRSFEFPTTPTDEGNQLFYNFDLGRLSLRDPTSPLPPVPLVPPQSRSEVVASSSIAYVRNPMSIQPSLSLTSVASVSSLSSLSEHENSIHSSQPSLAAASTIASPQHVVPTCAFPSSAIDNSLYEPLFCAAPLNENLNLVPGCVPNPSYENPPDSVRTRVNNAAYPPLPPKMNNISRRSHSVGSNENLESQRVDSSSHNNSSSSSSRVLATEHTQSSNSRFTSSGRIIRRYSSEELVGLTFIQPNRMLQGHSAAAAAQAQNAEESVHSGMPPHLRSSQTSVMDNPFPKDENGRILSLREAQVLRLQSEISHKSGVRLVLRRKDCLNAVAFVECYGCVWIAGWKQKEHPLLHSAFHIGDRISSIGGHRIHNIQEALKIIKLQTSVVEFVVRRTPYAKVLAIKREYEGQDLGIVREGGTAEIKEVKPGSLALRSGLSPKAPPIDVIGSCNWFLTEINHRPLNLFFKDNEVHDRLNAVGLDISILVQPVDFVKSLKKQLKAIRGYKDYTFQ